MRAPRILLVEDDEDLLELEEMLLRRIGGYDVERTSSVGRALDSMARRPPDLVLLDLIMPGKDGREFLRTPMVEASRVPIVVVSGVSRLTLAVELRRRLSGYLVKPFDAPHLISGCSHVLREPGIALKESYGNAIAGRS